MCDKATFPSRRRAARRARQLRGETGEPFRAYACPACAGWHLSTAPELSEPRPRWTRRRSTNRAETREEAEALARRMRGIP